MTRQTRRVSEFEEDPLDYCRNVTERGRTYHIPGCWGCVVNPSPSGGHNPDACTCKRPPKRDEIEIRLSRLERAIETLTRRLT
jgi:hypothetical protein